MGLSETAEIGFPVPNMESEESFSQIELHGGNWRAGWALDYHTTSSEHAGARVFETTRTEIGELLYQLKYHLDSSKIESLAERAARFLETRIFLQNLEAIIPVPPSAERAFQPVAELAVSIGRKVNLPAASEYLMKVKRTSPLKSLDDKKERRKELKEAFKAADDRFADKDVLVFDDLFRSGETLREVTRTLIEQGHVAGVYILTLTKTRKRK
jgi:predicted amidophosphoribosyltransferase